MNDIHHLATEIRTVMKQATLLLAVVLLTGCTQPDRARKVLESQGMTDVQITGYNFFSCSKDDHTHTGFKATAANGTKVEGTVCAGWFFKGATVRYD